MWAKNTYTAILGSSISGTMPASLSLEAGAYYQLME